MKILTSLILLASISLVSMAQESKKEIKNKEKAEQFKLIQELIQSRQFEFVGIRAIPQKGGQVDLTTRSNYLRITDANVSASMPYFGVANNAAYGTSNGGVIFDGAPLNYQVEENDKKRKVVIKFRMKEKMEVYDCILTINSVENATFSVTSSRRSSITYYGKVMEFTKDE